MLKNLRYFWKINVAVILASAVATAVLTGSLVVGDSVRGSLRALSGERLGRIDHALVAEHFFREGLADDLNRDSVFLGNYERAVPAVLMTGPVISASGKKRASSVNLNSIDDRFLQLFPDSPSSTDSIRKNLGKPSDQFFESLIINESLAFELNASPGDQMLVSLQKQSPGIHSESVLGRRETSDLLRTLRVVVKAVIPDRGIGRFGLDPHQQTPFNAFLSLGAVQKALNLPDAANAILVSEIEGVPASTSLNSILGNSLVPEDLGLLFRRGPAQISVESRAFVLSRLLVDRITMTAEKLSWPNAVMLTYLANKIDSGERTVPYSTVAAVEVDSWPDNVKLSLVSGTMPKEQDEIVLNEWTADDLSAQVGDSIGLEFFEMDAAERFVTRRSGFVVSGVVRMTDAATNSLLTPVFPGIHDATNIAEWNPPFPIDFSEIRNRDEEYWDHYRAAPKAFVSAAAGKKLWSSRFGEATAVWLFPDEIGERGVEKFSRAFMLGIEPGAFGFSFRSVSARNLEAASGATDFGSLFIGFSFFLIVSAALLVGLLFRLGVEQRRSEIGLLLALGYRKRTVRRRFVSEGLILASIGGVTGAFLALLYAWLVMVALRTLWVDAIGTTALSLYWEPFSLLIGVLASLLVVGGVIVHAVRSFASKPAPELLRKSILFSHRVAGRTERWVATALLSIAAVVTVTAVALGPGGSPVLFFAAGGAWLAGLLTMVRFRLRARPSANPAAFGMSLSRMSARNAARNPGRSLLNVTLVACASFVIVAVGANRKTFRSSTQLKTSGTGGFALMARSDIPVVGDLNSPGFREAAGFEEEAMEAVSEARFVSIRTLPGEDASCLNLYRPENPRILGVPDGLIERGGFSFQSAVDDTVSNPWTLLNRAIEPGVIPAIGDVNSITWILHSGLGQDIDLIDESGASVKLRFVALLNTSIFQREILISEEHLVKHFPGTRGYGTFLVSVDPGTMDRVATALESSLRKYGFDASETAVTLDRFQAVENTYLSVFQLLGGLGLLLGTFGLGIVLYRNLLERRSELALLRTFGFRSRTIGLMTILENCFLVALGLAIGSITAFLAVMPQILDRPELIPWSSVSLTLVAVFSAGLISTLISVKPALRLALMPTLRAD